MANYAKTNIGNEGRVELHEKYRRQIMNKKGFTLIELSISVALLSVVIIYLLYFLKTVRDEDEGINAVTEMVEAARLLHY